MFTSKAVSPIKARVKHASKSFEPIGTQVLLRLHKVKPGESLFSVAEKYGVSVGQLCRVNGKTTGKDLNLRLGEVLYLPHKVEGKSRLARSLSKSETRGETWMENIHSHRSKVLQRRNSALSREVKQDSFATVDLRSKASTFGSAPWGLLLASAATTMWLVSQIRKTIISTNEKSSVQTQSKPRRIANRFALPREELREVLGLSDDQNSIELATAALRELSFGQARSPVFIWDGPEQDRAEGGESGVLTDLESRDDEYKWLVTPSARAQELLCRGIDPEVLQQLKQQAARSPLVSDENCDELGEWSVAMAKDANARATGM